MDGEIDLCAYLAVLVRYWKWIAGLGFLATIAALAFSLLQPVTYEAEAAIAVVRMRTDVEFTSKIVTLSEDELANRALDMDARHKAYVALVSSNDVAGQVLEDLGDQLPSQQRRVHRLLRMVRASSEGDLILIKVRHQDPDTAALIANAWARNYERHINTLYGATGELDSTVAVQVATARATYDAAQAALEAFLGDNRLGALERELAARRELLGVYESARNAAQTRSLDLQLNVRQQVLTDHYADLRRIERWLTDLQALRSQIDRASDSAVADAANALALIQLQSQALGGGGDLPLQLQIDLADGGRGRVRLADVEALIQVLEARRAEAQQEEAALLAALVADVPSELVVEAENPLNLRIATLNDEILALQEELAAQQARERELTEARDLTWSTYQTLMVKQAEVGIASQVTDVDVRLASSAVTPVKPIGSRKMLNATVAAMLGLLVGVFGVFAFEFWRKNQDRLRPVEEPLVSTEAAGD